MSIRNLLRNLGLSVLLYSSAARAEYYNDPHPVSFGRNDVIVGGLEVLVGCAIAGLPHAPRWKKAARQCAKGSLAGLAIYGGEKAAAHASTPGMGWAAQILVNGGASMRENAAQDKGMLEEIGYTIGPLHLQVGKEVKWYVHTGFIPAVVEAFILNSNFNLEASLLSGTPVFEYTDSSKYSHTFANIIFINRNDFYFPEDESTLYATYGHEFVHTVQYRSFGTAELALRAIPSYALFSDKTHLMYGADVGSSSFYILSLPLAHEHRPMEFVPNRLDAHK